MVLHHQDVSLAAGCHVATCLRGVGRVDPRHQAAAHSQYNHCNDDFISRAPLHVKDRLVGLVVKASRVENPEFVSRWRRDFPGSSHTSDLKKWHSSGSPARRLALKGQRWDWLTRCQYIVTGWNGKFDLQLVSQCGCTCNCLSRSVPEIHYSMLLGR